MPSQKEPLSRIAKSTQPYVIANHIEGSQPKAAKLLRRLHVQSHVIDIYETCDITEYNVLGPVSYKYELYVYYANKDGPMYTYHTYDMSVKHPNPDVEEYGLESKQRRVPMNSPMYKRLKPLCEVQVAARLEIKNPFALLATEDDDE